MNVERKREARILENKEFATMFSEDDIQKAKDALEQYLKKRKEDKKTVKNAKQQQFYEKALKRHYRKFFPRCTFVPVYEKEVDFPDVWCIQVLMCIICKKIKIVPHGYYWKHIDSTAD